MMTKPSGPRSVGSARPIDPRADSGQLIGRQHLDRSKGSARALTQAELGLTARIPAQSTATHPGSARKP